MTKAELYALAEKYDAKAEKAFRNYQETGISRYGREYRNYEDLAMALRMAASANDDHTQLISIRCDVAILGAKAEDLLAGDLSYAYRDGRVRSLLNDVAAIAATYGLIRRQREP